MKTNLINGVTINEDPNEYDDNYNLTDVIDDISIIDTIKYRVVYNVGIGVQEYERGIGKDGEIWKDEQEHFGVYLKVNKSNLYKQDYMVKVIREYMIKTKGLEPGQEFNFYFSCQVHPNKNYQEYVKHIDNLLKGNESEMKLAA